MGLHFQFRRYRLPLRLAVRTAHETWTEREGLILKLEAGQGRAGFGEVAPIPAFGTETIEAAEAACRSLGEWPTDAAVASVPASLGCVRQALAAAMAALLPPAGAEVSNRGDGGVAPAAGARAAYRAVAGLLPAGRAALEQLRTKAEGGFRVFKWKVGVGRIEDELPLFDDVCAALPPGGRIRLDANGGWSRRQAERWLERCAERPVEFVEQPCFAPATTDANLARRTDDILLGLAHDFPTPIALDESLVGDGDVERWVGAGWPGWFVVKPSLLGDIAGALARLEAAGAAVVFSSALETAVGARAALRIAFAWRGEPHALGFGVWPLFADRRFDGPAAAPFVRAEDIARINPEDVWNALT